MTQAEIYTAVPEHLPKNFPFYNWVPKPLGIAFLVILFIPIMTVSGAYTVNSSEMVGAGFSGGMTSSVGGVSGWSFFPNRSLI